MTTDAGAGEIIFASISATNIAVTPFIDELSDLIKTKILPENLWYVPDSSDLGIDFQSLATYRIGDVTKGTPKLMFMNGDLVQDKNPKYLKYSDTITDTMEYAGIL